MIARKDWWFRFSLLSCSVLLPGWTAAHGQEGASPLPADIDQRLLEGLDQPPPLDPNSKGDVPGEDLGAAKPESALADLARRMRGVKKRMLRDDTSATTQQLQTDIAADLARLLEAAKQAGQSRSATDAATKRSDQARETASEASSGDPRPREGELAEQSADLLDAIWGHLPNRLRQQIQSPLQEEFLPRYERVIKQYYKRLAEQQRRLRD